MLATKLHALFLPLVLLIHNLRYRRFDWRIYLMMALLGPPVYVLVQPILWHHPIATTLDRLAGLGGMVESGPIPLYYLGEVHYGDTPWHYPLVMTLVTFPLPILALLALAAGAGLRRWWGRAARYATTTAAGGDAEARPSISPPAYSGVAIAAAIEARRRRLSETPRSEWVFTFLVSAAVSFGIVLLPKAQAYDGLRLILPGVVSLVLLSSLGFSRLVAWSVVRVGWLPWRYLSRVPAVLLFALLLPGAFSTLARHPWQLSHYNLLGAAVGLDQFETAYWCEGLSRAAAADLNRRLKQDATLWVVAGSWDQIRYYQEQGWLRRDILLPPEAQPPFDYHLLQVRQGMFQRLGWELYRHGKRVAEYGPPGRPVYILYGSLEEALRGS
ncbi:hypothetical protein HS125_01980 [bacterium]|nr:hypothetical protein [bacterium]